MKVQLKAELPLKEVTPEAVALKNLASNYYNGSDKFYRHKLSGLVYTSGVQKLCDVAGAYWLLDCIGSYQKRCMKDKMLRDFQLWTMRKYNNNSCHVICWRDSNDLAFFQELEYTDFPWWPEFKLYVENKTVMFPDER